MAYINCSEITKKLIVYTVSWHIKIKEAFVMISSYFNNYTKYFKGMIISVCRNVRIDPNLNVTVGKWISFKDQIWSNVVKKTFKFKGPKF